MVDDGSREGQALPQLQVDNSEMYRQLTVREPTWRERTARTIAFSILLLFGGSLFCAFVIGCYLIHRSQGTLDQSSIEVSLSYFKSVGSLFTPLLAFILGYYFTKKEEE